MSTFCRDSLGLRSAAHRSQIARGEQPRQRRVHGADPVLGVAGGAAEDGAEGADGGERLPCVLRLGEVVAVVRDDELVAEVGGEGACPFGEAPQLEQVRVEAREIGVRPLARPRGRVRLTGARLSVDWM